MLSLHFSLDANLVPSVVSMEPMPELPDGAPNQPSWHRAAMQRVASDALNLTGATLHPRRREMHVELRSQLHRVLSAHKHKKKKGVSSVGARQRNKERGGSKGSGGRSKSLKKDLLKEKKRDMKHSQSSGGVQPPRHREPPPKRSWFGGASTDAKPPSPPPVSYTHLTLPTKA